MAEGDLYIGIRYEFEDGAYWELMTVCEKNAVTDCSRNSALERFMYKEEYVGKTYEQAFQDFYFLNQPAEDHGLPVKITLILMKDDNRKKYENVLKSIMETIAPSAETDVQEDDRWHFDEVIEEEDLHLQFVVVK